jgi:hypothetical protein
MQSAPPHAPPDGVGIEARVRELGDRDHPVLARRERRDHCVRAGGSYA